MNGIFLAVLIALLAYGLYRAGVGRSRVAAHYREKAAAFLADNRLRPGVEETASGLQCEVLQAGAGERHPGPRDQVRVHYHGTLADGTVFDSSVQRGEPITFALNQVIPGWTEGLQRMVVGEKTRFFIPPDLAYGNQQAGQIPPGSLLIFEVELLAIPD